MTSHAEVAGLSIRMGAATILDRVDLSIAAGEIVALVGPNGAGKSTLLRVLSGELGPSTGQVLLHGKAIDSYSPHRLSEHRAMLTQQTTITFPFTVSEIVQMGGGQVRSRSWIESMSRNVMAQCDIAHLAQHTVTSLSGGERQRAHLARIMLQLLSSTSGLSKLLLLDEPTASLDIAHQLTVLGLIRGQARAGTTVVIVLHDLNLAAMVADRVVLMRDGTIVQVGSPKQVIGNEALEAAFGVSNAVDQIPADGTPFVLPQSMAISVRD